jgi:hypothetical protein
VAFGPAPCAAAGGLGALSCCRVRFCPIGRRKAVSKPQMIRFP